jgi:hypothetical protein
MILVKSTLLVHIIVQSLILITVGLIATLPRQDVLILTDFTKSELISIAAAMGYVWQFLMAILFFLVPPFAYKNQMLDLTIILAYPILTVYTFLIIGIPLISFIQSPSFWTIAILAIIYYFVSILDITGPVAHKKRSYHRHTDNL